MQSNAVLGTAVIACLGFLINSSVLLLVLLRGRNKYHYLFAAVLFAHAMWDMGIFLAMIRNSFVNEVIIYCYIAVAGPIFLPALFYHFTCSYINQSRRKSTVFIWIFCACVLIYLCTLYGEIGINHFSWGNLWRLPSPWGLLVCSFWFAVAIVFIGSSCWLMFRAYRQETSTLHQRHMLYILISLLVTFLALEKGLVNYNIDNRYMIPVGILFTDIFGAFIGIAIIKHGLLDITVIIKKTTIYSILLALVIFIFSLSEHLLASYVGEFFGEHSVFIHIISIAVVIAVLMPVRQKIERAIEHFFAKKTVEF